MQIHRSILFFFFFFWICLLLNFDFLCSFNLSLSHFLYMFHSVISIPMTFDTNLGYLSSPQVCKAKKEKKKTNKYSNFLLQASICFTLDVIYLDWLICVCAKIGHNNCRYEETMGEKKKKTIEMDQIYCRFHMQIFSVMRLEFVHAVIFYFFAFSFGKGKRARISHQIKK